MASEKRIEVGDTSQVFILGEIRDCLLIYAGKPHSGYFARRPCNLCNLSVPSGPQHCGLVHAQFRWGLERRTR
jgi:hypothetical protein